jgi:dTDP-4-amino-4,6-dideoxygalactose transaminase
LIEYENLFHTNKVFLEDYKKSFNNILNSGRFILGKSVEQFEKDFSQYHKVKHCVGVASGLDALFLSLKALNFDKNSEVIVPSNTYIATILSIINADLKPILVEPDIETYNINPLEIEKAINPKTKAVMLVHLYGKSCRMDNILEICNENKIKVIEDCAQSHGAMFKGKLTGIFGDIGAFSFYPTKNLGALGDGGAIITNNDSIANEVRRLRNYGSDVKYYNEVIGYNSRLDEIQAVFLSIKLKKLDQINLHKRKLANIYLENIKKDFITPSVHKDHFDVYHIFNVRHPRRDQLRSYLLKHQIKTEIHYPVPPHKQKALADVISGTFPISEEIHNTTLSLPCSFGHTEEEIYKVVEIINKF